MKKIGREAFVNLTLILKYSQFPWTSEVVVVFVFISLTLSIFLLLQHLSAYKNPEEQKILLGIVLMVPSYAIESKWVHLVQKGNVLKAMSKDILSDVLIVYCFITMWFVGGLSVFQFYLICSNQTTYENFRYRYDKKENSYHEGITRNLLQVFLSKIPPSLKDFRAIVHEDENMVIEETSSPTSNHT